jgi:3-oxoisoapionate decarboxylase
MMHRREFLGQLFSNAMAGVASAATGSSIPLGLNTYCLRALRWHDIPLLDYAASLRLDACFLQDSVDPGVMDAGHWAKVREHARGLGLRLETGGGIFVPKSAEEFESTVRTFERQIDRAKALGSPVVRCLIASERATMPSGPVEQTMETAVKVLRRVRTRALDAGLKLAIENHKEIQAWATREVIETAGKEFVGSYLDTGNPVFVAEDPLTTVEELGHLAVCVHLRDSVIYEHPQGIAVQWVPLGEGVNDFVRIVQRVRELCPPVALYVKPITGRPPAVLPVYDDAFWKLFPKARSADFARFAALARRGRPYEKHVVIEDIPGRQTPEAFLPAVQYQQREHMERSVEYAKKTLGLGIRWRS